MAVTTASHWSEGYFLLQAESHHLPTHNWCFSAHTNTLLQQYAIKWEFVHDILTFPLQLPFKSYTFLSLFMPLTTYLSQTVLQRSNTNMGVGVPLRGRHDSQPCLTHRGIIMPLHFNGHLIVKKNRGTKKGCP